jgi:hypothetical protein
MTSKCEFNFFYKKDSSIKMVIVNDRENLKMNEFLLLAIREFNNQCSDTAIVEETDYYKILLLEEKTRQPDFDLPKISHELIVKDSNWNNFSIPLNDEHFVMGPPETINKDQVNNSKSNLLTNPPSENQNLVSKKKDNSIEINENSGGLCCCLLACFGKKK